MEFGWEGVAWHGGLGGPRGSGGENVESKRLLASGFQDALELERLGACGDVMEVVQSVVGIYDDVIDPLPTSLAPSKIEKVTWPKVFSVM